MLQTAFRRPRYEQKSNLLFSILYELSPVTEAAMVHMTPLIVILMPRQWYEPLSSNVDILPLLLPFTII